MSSRHLYHDWNYNSKPRPLYCCARCGRQSNTRTRDVCPGKKS